MKAFIVSMLFVSSISTSFANCLITENERWPSENFPTSVLKKETISPIAECTIVLQDPYVKNAEMPDGGWTRNIRKGCVYRAKNNENQDTVGVIVSGVNEEGRFTIMQNALFTSYSESSRKIKMRSKIDNFTMSVPGVSYAMDDSYVFDKVGLELKIKMKMQESIDGKSGKWITKNALKLGCKAL